MSVQESNPIFDPDVDGLAYPIWKAAREQVLKGPIIPCRPGTKIPMVKGWSKNLEAGPGQLRTVEAVDAFWSENPTANLAIMPHEYGWGVVECDTYKDGCEAHTLNLPPTGTIRSPRGGEHKYYVGVLPPMQNNELAKHVDTRGKGSIVLLPPSNVTYDDGFTGEYSVLDDRAPVPMPDNIKERIDKLATDVREALPNAEEDDPRAIKAGRELVDRYIRNGWFAVEGERGDNATIKLCFRLARDLYLSEETCMELLEPWNEQCDPPWQDSELRVKIQSAIANGQNARGSDIPRKASEVFKKYERPNNDNSNDGARREQSDRPRYFKAMDLLAAAAKPKPRFWDKRGLFVRNEGGAIVELYGGKGIHKTGVALCETVEWALFNEDAKIAYFAGEAPDEVARARLPAICQHHEKELADLVATNRFHLIDKMPQLLDGNEMNTVLADLEAINPNVVVIDTKSRAMLGMNLNQSEIMSAAFAAAERIREKFKCLVIVIHHTGKDQSKGGKGDGSFENAADMVLVASQPQKGYTQVVLAHSRYSRTDRIVVFKVQNYSDGEKYTDVPVLVPIENAASVPADKTSNKKLQNRLKVIRQLVHGEAIHESEPASWGFTDNEMAERMAGPPPDKDNHPAAYKRWVVRKDEWYAILRSQYHGNKNSPDATTLDKKYAKNGYLHGLRVRVVKPGATKSEWAWSVSRHIVDEMANELFSSDEGPIEEAAE